MLKAMNKSGLALVALGLNAVILAVVSMNFLFGLLSPSSALLAPLALAIPYALAVAAILRKVSRGLAVAAKWLNVVLALLSGLVLVALVFLWARDTLPPNLPISIVAAIAVLSGVAPCSLNAWVLRAPSEA